MKPSYERYLLNIFSTIFILFCTATWHQYDDAVYSEPGFWDNLCSHIPLLRNVALDPAEGRTMTMMAMLPEWNRISIVDGSGIHAHEALSVINNVVYCMSMAEFENGGSFFPRIPHGFNFVQVCTSNGVLKGNFFFIYEIFIF